MPLLVLALTGSAAEAGLVGVARTIVYPLAALPAGIVADRFERRRVMMGCAAGRAIAIGSVPLALALGHPPFVQLLLATFIDGALVTTNTVAERGLLAQIVPASALPEAVTANEVRSASASLAGPPAGGVLFGIARALPFVADAASYLVVIVAVAGVRPPPRGEPIVRAAGWRAAVAEGVDGFHWLWREPFLRAGALLYAAANLTLLAVDLLGLLIARRHGASPAAIGGAFAIVGAAGLVGAALAGPLRRRLSVRAAVLIEPWCYCVFAPLLLVAHSPVAIGLVVGAMATPLTLSSSVILSRRLALTPDRLRSRVQASSSFLSSSISWIGPLAIGVLVQYAGEASATLSLTGYSLVVAVAATLARGLRAAPALPDD
jgi:hypothetical protein